MKKKHTQSVDSTQKNCEYIDEERKEGSLIERIILMVDSGKTKEEIVQTLYESNAALLRKLLLN